DDVEAHAREERDAASLGFGVARVDRLEDVDYAGDVEVVRARAQTRVDGGAARLLERAGREEERVDLAEGRVEGAVIFEREAPRLEAGGERELLDGLGVPAVEQ